MTTTHHAATVFAAHHYAVQLCKSANRIPDPSACDRLRCEVKIDGYRAVVHHLADGTVRLMLGRDSTDHTGRLPYLEAQIAASTPPDTILDGELHHPNGFSAVQTAMAGRDVHRPDPGYELGLYVFDVLALAGRDLRPKPLHERLDALDCLRGQVGGLPTLISTAQGIPCTQEAYESVVSNGAEGVVLKHLDGAYIPGRGWVKVKPTDTVEAIVTAVETTATGNRVLICDLLDGNDRPTGQSCRAAGLDDAELGVAAGWVGEVVELAHNGQTSSGGLRHPRFVRRRADRTTDTTATPVAAAVPQPNAAAVNTGWLRNYNAMGAPKLAKALQQLQAGAGEAVDRVLAKGGSVPDNLAAANSAARAKGLL